MECCVNLNCLKLDPLFKDALDGKNHIKLTDEMKTVLKINTELSKKSINEKKTENEKLKTRNQTLDSFFVLKSTPTTDNNNNSRLRNRKRKRSSVSSESNSSINTKKIGKTLIDDDDDVDDDVVDNVGGNETMKLIDDTMKRIDEDEIQVVSPDKDHTKITRKSKEVNKENVI